MAEWDRGQLRDRQERGALLVRERHPDLAGLDIREVADGWDNQLWCLGEELSYACRVRSVRRPSCARSSGGCPLWRRPFHHRSRSPCGPVNRPRASRGRGPSQPGCPANRPTAPRSATAVRLTPWRSFSRRFMRRRPPTHRSVPIAGFPFERSRTVSGSWSRKSPPEGAADGLRPVRDVWDEALATPEWEGPPAWLRAGLHPADVVVSDGTLSGVIDFGDMCAGDPAVGLAAAWVLLPAGAAARFFDAYAQADEAMIRRARGLAALEEPLPRPHGPGRGARSCRRQADMGPAGRAALDRVLAPVHDLGSDWGCPAGVDPDGSAVGVGEPVGSRFERRTRGASPDGRARSQSTGPAPPGRGHRRRHPGAGTATPRGRCGWPIRVVAAPAVIAVGGNVARRREVSGGGPALPRRTGG